MIRIYFIKSFVICILYILGIYGCEKNIENETIGNDVTIVEKYTIIDDESVWGNHIEEYLDINSDGVNDLKIVLDAEWSVATMCFIFLCMA